MRLHASGHFNSHKVVMRTEISTRELDLGLPCCLAALQMLCETSSALFSSDRVIFERWRIEYSANVGRRPASYS